MEEQNEENEYIEQIEKLKKLISDCNELYIKEQPKQVMDNQQPNKIKDSFKVLYRVLLKNNYLCFFAKKNQIKFEQKTFESYFNNKDTQFNVFKDPLPTKNLECLQIIVDKLSDLQPNFGKKYVCNYLEALQQIYNDLENSLGYQIKQEKKFSNLKRLFKPLNQLEEPDDIIFKCKLIEDQGTFEEIEKLEFDLELSDDITSKAFEHFGQILLKKFEIITPPNILEKFDNTNLNNKDLIKFYLSEGRIVYIYLIDAQKNIEEYKEFPNQKKQQWFQPKSQSDAQILLDICHNELDHLYQGDNKWIITYGVKSDPLNCYFGAYFVNVNGQGIGKGDDNIFGKCNSGFMAIKKSSFSFANPNLEWKKPCCNNATQKNAYAVLVDIEEQQN